MRLTKNDMARVVVQALYNLPSLPASDDSRVANIAKRTKLDRLTCQHATAMRVLTAKVAS